MIITLIVSAFVGYLAGSLMKVKKPWYINILLGIVGGTVGSFLFGLLGLNASNILGSILVSTVGACVVIALVRAFK